MKIIVKRWKKSSLPSLQKRQSFSSSNKSVHAYTITALFSSIIGTYLDLIFVETGMYYFPVRLFPDIFAINIVFTLFILPVFTILFLAIAKHLKPLSCYKLIIVLSLAVVLAEQVSEQLGWFIHQTEWNHIYSFFGYMLFFIIIWKIFRFFQQKTR